MKKLITCCKTLPLFIMHFESSSLFSKNRHLNRSKEITVWLWSGVETRSDLLDLNRLSWISHNDPFLPQIVLIISPIHTFVNTPALIRKRSMFLRSRAGILTKVWIRDIILKLEILNFWNKNFTCDNSNGSIYPVLVDSFFEESFSDFW